MCLIVNVFNDETNENSGNSVNCKIKTVQPRGTKFLSLEISLKPAGAISRRCAS